MEQKIALPDINLLTVWDDDAGVEYCGSHQEWYADEWQRLSGCGPSVAANIFFYRRRKSQDPPERALKKDLLRLMEEIWEYVTPGRNGIPDTGDFLSKVAAYAAAHDIKIRSEALDIPGEHSLRPARETVIEFIAEGLRRETPVAFLNLCSGDEPNLDRWHWVTVIELRYDTENKSAMAVVSDEGVIKEINLALWLSTTTLGGGFVYFVENDT